MSVVTVIHPDPAGDGTVLRVPADDEVRQYEVVRGGRPVAS